MNAPARPGIDGRLLRTVCGQFATGVTVITSGDGADASGTTVNSFTSVSLDPPLVLFCLHTDSRLRELIETTGHFTVNLLARPQEKLAWAFAGRHTAALSDHPHFRSVGGAAVLSGALAFLGCRLVDTMSGGDHLIMLGEVRELDILHRTREPLIFFRGLMSALADDPSANHPIWDG